MSKKIHLICASHIDPIWLWNWQDGAAEAVSTFRIAAEFCENNDDFIFCHNEALLYEWVEEYDPELFGRICGLVRAGKWYIIGGWYLQPDCNLPSGEGFVRQILAGHRYFREKFGVVPDVAVNFDSFGHTRGLVQILQKSGYRGYMFSRPLVGQMEFPSEIFEWRGYDGSEVTAVRLTGGGYGTLKGKAAEKIRGVIDSCPDGETSFVVWGIGNHGGALSAEDLKDISMLREEYGESCNILHSTPEALFDELSGKRYKVFAESLNPCNAGCYTTMSRLKRKYRRCENMLFSTEKMCTHAMTTGLTDYPSTDIRAAEKALLTVQFHDALAGTSIKEAEETLMDMLGSAERLLSKARMKAFTALASCQRKAYPDAIPVMVYNPYPYEVEKDLSCDLMLWEQDRTGDFLYPVMYDENGNALPTQPEKEKSTIAIEWAKRVIFHARLKPMSMNRFDCRFRRLDSKPTPNVTVRDDAFIFDNAGEHIEINRKTGLISVYSKDDADILGKGACALEVYRDNYDPWGMLQSKWDEKVGEFRLLSPEEGQKFAALENQIESVRVIEDGDVRTTVEAVFGYMTSRAVLHYIISKNGGMEVSLRVIWNEPEKMLRLRLPAAFRIRETIGDEPFGVEKLRGNMSENCSGQYVIAESDNTSFAVYNNGTYGSAVDSSGNAILISLLRSPVYSGHPTRETGNTPQDRYLPHIDIGEREFVFSFVAGNRMTVRNNAARQAAVLNDPPMTISMYPDGKGHVTKPGVIIEGDDAILLSAWKPAEDNNGSILRLFNPTDERRKARLVYMNISCEISLVPYEIKSMRVSGDHITETDLNEQTI